jgi:putative chitinase
MSNEILIKKLENKIPVSVYNHLANSKNLANITNNTRLAHFLAQVAHESGNFKLVYENLRYSANGLRKTFPRYFTTDALAKQYAMQPELIGNRVYANRMGNGNEASGEGYLFRGRGYLQLTGKSNYQLLSQYVGENLVASPDKVATKYPMDSALWFFDRNKLWELCDLSTPESVAAVTRRVNGGFNGLADRQSKFKAFMSFLA